VGFHLSYIGLFLEYCFFFRRTGGVFPYSIKLKYKEDKTKFSTKAKSKGKITRVILAIAVLQGNMMVWLYE